MKVVDFGIAKIMHGSDLDGDTLARSGQLVGTSDYMAPEQIVNSARRRRSCSRSVLSSTR